MLASQLLAIVAMGTTAMAAPSTIKLRADDVVLYGNGRYQIIKRTELNELEALRKNGTVPPMPGNLNPNLVTSSGPSTSVTQRQTRSIQKRGSSTIVIPNPDSRFLGWDVQMSQVVSGAPTTITVSTGYEISNSISVGTSATLGIVEDFLSASVSIDYSQSWTSQQLQQFEGDVPAGKYGAFVSNPWTNRKSGNVFEGTVGSEGSLTGYQADSFEEKAFGQMQWVDGVISLCVGDVFPLPRCLGEGTL
ncbi:hypothetical protein DPSP01_010827 [Paraphaeosphaeria sporulosa]|uniref:Celp0028 effector like protein n=1 Tax=Paraphaeosphaeria sporulosa TaxID=1460663 RepID=A0A177C119_9PLEO|nr:uncharacterized protein CC84DRAFT_186491 [Paraphaeosphaeria sporulosa]OAG01333.1 hypothetical protein CC84DRAFT_186491 [Paraphaeosphaeria sporulosa]